MIVEQHPAVRAVLEHLLIREGYSMWYPEKSSGVLQGESRVIPKGPMLLLIGAEDGDGLYVFETRDVAGILAGIPPGEDLLGHFFSKADGVRTYLPKPFGAADVLRVVRAVGGFDARRKGFYAL